MIGQIGTAALIITAIAAIVGLFVIIRIQTYHYPACYFLLQFIGRNLIDFSRVRYMIAFQLAIIAFLMLIAIVKRKKDQKPVKNSLQSNLLVISVIIMCLISISFVYGLMTGYDKMQILIDVYKYVEIYILFLFLKSCVNSTENLYRGLVSMTVIMSVLGVVEIFTTSRGGIGLNMMMSVTPIMLVLGVYGKYKYYKPLLLITLAVVFISQTRTYVIGFAFALILLIIFVSKQQRSRTFKAIVPAAFTLVPMAMVFIPEQLQMILNRFISLTSGFAYAGGYRIYEIQIAMEKLKQHPAFGEGFGYTENLYINNMGYFEWGSFLHSAFVEVLLKNGLFIGVGLFLCLIVLLVVCFKHFVPLRNINTTSYALGIGGLCSTLGWLLVYGFAPLSSYGSAFVGLIIAVIAFNLYSREQQAACHMERTAAAIGCYGGPSGDISAKVIT